MCKAHRRALTADCSRNSACSTFLYGVECTMSCMPHCAGRGVQFQEGTTCAPPHAPPDGGPVRVPFPACPPPLQRQAHCHERGGGHAGRNVLGSVGTGTTSILRLVADCRRSRIVDPSEAGGLVAVRPPHSTYSGRTCWGYGGWTATANIVVLRITVLVIRS